MNSERSFANEKPFEDFENTLKTLLSFSKQHFSSKLSNLQSSESSKDILQPYG